MVATKRKSKSVTTCVFVKESGWQNQGCVVRGSVRDFSIFLRITDGRNNWAHLTEAQTKHLIEFLKKGLREIDARKRAVLEARQQVCQYHPTSRS